MKNTFEEWIIEKFVRNTKINKLAPKKNKNMNLNRLLGEKKSIIVALFGIDFLFYYIITYVANFVTNFATIFQSMGNSKKYLGLHRGLWYAGPGKVIYYFSFLVVLFVLDLFLYYKFKVSFSEEYFNIGQKGNARWTTLDEIKKQYKEIPEKDLEYEGYPGTIVAHFDEKIYIDTNISNNLGIGITRSGKGECYILPSIDVYSRAEFKPSLIVTDPKMENYKSSKKTLEARGYEVHLLNLDDPLHSMGYNPLTLVISFFTRGDKANAYAIARTFAYSIFHSNDDGQSEPIWKNTATDLFTALIIAVTSDLLELDEALNEMRMQSYNVKQTTFSKLSEVEKVRIREEINILIESGEDVVTNPMISAIPDDIPFVYQRPHEKQINIYNIIILFTELVRQKNPINESLNKLDEYFNKRSTTDLAKLKYATVESASERTKGSVYTNMLSHLGTFIDENIAKMTADSSVNLEDVGFGDKPIAIFLGIPDYDKSSHFIASVFVRQLYFILAKRATNSENQKCRRNVRFILDEFGNMPPIEAMDEIITVSNGRGIGFDLWVQSYAQISKLYGDDAQTIIDNCANEIYIKSGDDETLEKISKMLGTQTYIDVQRTGSKLSLNRTFMETPSDRPLMRLDELKGLKEGECVVQRKLKRKDLQGKNIDTTPIFNNVNDGTEFLYRYMYLTDTFPNPDTYPLSSINTESREHIDLQERVINIEELLRGIDEQVGMKPEITFYRKSENFEVIDKKLREVIGEDYWDILGISQNASLALVISIIENTSLLKDKTKVAIKSLAEN